MITRKDVKAAIQYCKDQPKEAAKLIVMSAALTAGAMVVGILTVKGATAIQEQLKNQK